MLKAAEKMQQLLEESKELAKKEAFAKREQELDYQKRAKARAVSHLHKFVKEILQQIAVKTKQLETEYSITFYERHNEQYLVVDLIAKALRKHGFVVEEKKYFSPGSYGDQGEVFVEGRVDEILNISWKKE